MITFLRRKALGAGSLRGMVRIGEKLLDDAFVSVRHYKGSKFSIVRNDMIDRIPDETELLVRWGCASGTNVPLKKQVNRSEAIHFVANKASCRMWLQQYHPDIVPKTYVDEAPIIDKPMVLRPAHHHQGKNFFIVSTQSEFHKALESDCFSVGWYLSDLIGKMSEYRVYVMTGRVITVARKTPGNPNQVAWNVAQGGRFDVVPWGQWPLEACRAAVQAANSVPHLDFTGVDVMLDDNGKAYVIEMNSAPSLPLLSDGSVSYRQRCMVKGFEWMLKEGRKTMTTEHNNGWRGYIHPAIGGN